ncbi:hypothetical protein ACQPXS_28305 [Streptomyces sp. CA-142005]
MAVEGEAVQGQGPEFAELGELGAIRITFGPGLQRLATAAVRDIAATLKG